MTRAHKIEIGVVAGLVLAGALAGVYFSGVWQRKAVVLHGALITQSSDPHKQTPITGAEITLANGLAVAPVKSDSSGLFALTLQKSVRRGQAIVFHFRHPDYKPLDLKEFAGDKLYVIHLDPLAEPKPQPNHPQTTVANVLVRYSLKAAQTINIGSAVKPFSVENTGNVPCKGHHPCSPDGKWKASIGSAELDAGAGNEFRNVRASCIAGPCPFTSIRTDMTPDGSRVVKATAINWSDTATFLMEAEVFHPMYSDMIRESYPVIFGQALNFTLPNASEGVSIQAEINGETIVFPLGPTLVMRWADCNARVNPDQTRVYRCRLKSEFRFK
ncbi:MAG TPA: hypothetical protein VGF06_02310 [Terriglobales bacterium]|jgi:hypothetical protein